MLALVNLSVTKPFQGKYASVLFKHASLLFFGMHTGRRPADVKSCSAPVSLTA